MLAVIYPVQQSHVVEKLAGKYKQRVTVSNMDIEAIKETAIQMAMKART